jgi:hypothetical protein
MENLPAQLEVEFVGLCLSCSDVVDSEQQHSQSSQRKQEITHCKSDFGFNGYGNILQITAECLSMSTCLL